MLHISGAQHVQAFCHSNSYQWAFLSVPFGCGVIRVGSEDLLRTQRLHDAQAEVVKLAGEMTRLNEQHTQQRREMQAKIDQLQMAHGGSADAMGKAPLAAAKSSLILAVEDLSAALQV